jgi:hypothetical protein
MKTARSLLLILFLPLIPSAALAQMVISINFEGGQANPDLMGPGTAQVTATAGVVPAANWNNFPDWMGAGQGLADDSGTAVDALLTYAVQNNWAATNAAPGDGANGDMMSGHLDNLQNAADGVPNFITVDNLGPAFTANGYDVYVYQNADSGGVAAGFIMNETATHYLLQVGGGGSNYPLTDPGNVDGFVVSQATDPALATSSNVVLFENLTGDSFSITGVAGAGGARPRPNGIQIVARVPIVDTDMDDLDDDWEMTHFGDLTAQDGTGDPDLDTLLNLDEFNGGTDPNEKDTDDDGLDDNVENRTGIFVDATMTGTHPLIDDSDGDTLLDGDEVNGAPFPSDPNRRDTDGDTLNDDSELDANPFVTNPGNEDTDGDDWTDPQEIALGTDPTDPTDFPQTGGGGASISVNFNSDRDAAAEMAPDTTAGAPGYTTDGWNNFNDVLSAAGPYTQTTAEIDSPNAGALSDNSGVPVSTTITWSSNNSWNTNNGSADGDNQMMNGYLDNSGAQPVVPIAVTGIPYSRYTVVAYFGSDGNDRTGTIDVTGGATYSYSTFSQQAGGFPGSYTQTTDTGGGNPNANYAVWENLTAPDFTLTINRGSNNSGFHGFQIISEAPAKPVQINIIEFNPNTGVVTLTWDGRSGVEYLLDYSLDLLDWVELTDGVIGGEGVVTQTPAPFAADVNTFYRFREQGE